MVDQDDHGAREPSDLAAVGQYLAHVLAAVLIAPGHDLGQRVHHHDVKVSFEAHLLDHSLDISHLQEVGCDVDERHGQPGQWHGIREGVGLHALAHVFLALGGDPAHLGARHLQAAPGAVFNLFALGQGLLDLLSCKGTRYSGHQVEHKKALAGATGAVYHSQIGVGYQALDDPARLLPLRKLLGGLEGKALLMDRRDLFCLNHLGGLGQVVELGHHVGGCGGLGLGFLAVLKP